MLTLVAGSGFAPQFAGRAPAPVLPRAAAPQLQDVAIKDESDSGFQFESNSDGVHEQHKELESVGLGGGFSLDAPLIEHDLVESLISGGDEPDKPSPTSSSPPRSVTPTFWRTCQRLSRVLL